MIRAFPTLMHRAIALLCAAGCMASFSCTPRIKHPHRAVFFTVAGLMRDDTTQTGFFTAVSLFDSAYDEAAYKTKPGETVVPNDGTQNVLICRYDTSDYRPIWIAVGGGPGADGGCNYYAIPSENSVYVLGYFEGTAQFPIKAGSKECRTIVSRGMADMFIAKYSYDTGALLWLSSGGSAYSDIIFRDTDGALHKETLMTVDAAVVTIYANFFGTSQFENQSIDAKLTGSGLQISYDKQNGEVKDVRFVTSLPVVLSGSNDK